MFRYGIISEFDPEAGKVRVTFNEDGIVSDWLPVLVPFAMKDKMSIPVSVNEQVCCAMDAESEDGVCLGAVMNDEDKPYTVASADKFGVKFEDGTLVQYNKATHILNINLGTAQMIITGNVTITGVLSVGGIGPIAPAVTIPGGLKIAGTIEATEVKAGGKSLAAHVHSGVTTGGGTSGFNT